MRDINTEPMSNKRQHLPPWPLILVMALVYGGFFFLSARNESNCIKLDSGEYLRLAGNLSQHDVFSMSASVSPFAPELFRLPGYPLFLALTHASENSSVLIAVGIQYLFCLLFITFFRVAAVVPHRGISRCIARYPVCVPGSFRTAS